MPVEPRTEYGRPLWPLQVAGRQQCEHREAALDVRQRRHENAKNQENADVWIERPIKFNADGRFWAESQITNGEKSGAKHGRRD